MRSELFMPSNNVFHTPFDYIFHFAFLMHRLYRLYSIFFCLIISVSSFVQNICNNPILVYFFVQIAYETGVLEVNQSMKSIREKNLSNNNTIMEKNNFVGDDMMSGTNVCNIFITYVSMIRR